MQLHSTLSGKLRVLERNSTGQGLNLSIQLVTNNASSFDLSFSSRPIRFRIHQMMSDDKAEPLTRSALNIMTVNKKKKKKPVNNKS